MRSDDLIKLLRKAQQMRAAGFGRAQEALAALDRVLPAEKRAGVLAQMAQMNRLVRSPAFQAALRRAQADAEELQSLYHESPVAFVVDLLDGEVAARLLRADASQRDALMVALFERALLERPHLDQVEHAVREAPLLADAQREDLLLAVSLLRKRPVPWGSASRLLLGGYEGLLWRWARDQNIIDDARKMTQRTKGRPDFAKGVDRILDEDGLPLPDEHRRFVRARVFDNLSNDIRHGRATIGHRECGLVVLFALGAWLDEQTGSRLREDASARMNRHFTDFEDEPAGDSDEDDRRQTRP